MDDINITEEYDDWDNNDFLISFILIKIAVLLCIFLVKH